MSNKNILKIKCFMLIINIAAVIFLAGLVYFTTWRICSFYIARDFLSNLDAIPKNPGVLLVETMALAVCLILSFFFREYIYAGNMKFCYASLIFDSIFCVVLMSFLDFNYNGILFWVFANVIYYARDKVRGFIMTVAVLIYMITDYEFLSIRYSLFSVNDYMNYYDSNVQQYFLGAYNVLVSLNIIMFILFCVYVIQEQSGIIDKVNSLYSQLTQKNAELESVNDELKKYADIKEKMGETKERNRLAREIHDTLGHTLTGISAGIDACLTMIEKDPQVTKKQLELISNVTRAGIGEVRRSVSELRPDALERLNLEQAIENMIQDMTLVTNAKVYFSCEAGNLKFDEDEENTIYRVVQESITNAVRHGRATKVWVTITREDYEIHLRIKDNGAGCTDMKKGFGTKHMIERIQMLHGTVNFKGDNGFLVDAVIPIRWGEEYD